MKISGTTNPWKTEWDEWHITNDRTSTTYSGTITIDDPSCGLSTVKKAFGVKTEKQNYGIRKIILNPQKHATTVLWEDGTATVVKRSEGDDPADIWMVVAYALAEKVYGSNSAFKRQVKGKVENINERKKRRNINDA